MSGGYKLFDWDYFGLKDKHSPWVNNMGSVACAYLKVITQFVLAGPV